MLWSEEGQRLALCAEPEDARREQRLVAAMDRVAERFGRGKLQLGLPRKHKNLTGSDPQSQSLSHSQRVCAGSARRWRGQGILAQSQMS